jgi:hypothetical protein
MDFNTNEILISLVAFAGEGRKITKIDQSGEPPARQAVFHFSDGSTQSVPVLAIESVFMKRWNEAREFLNNLKDAEISE